MPVCTELMVTARPESVAKARGFLASISKSLANEVHENARVVISELVTNSIRHAGLRRDEWIHLRAEIGQYFLRVEVADRGPSFSPQMPVADDEVERGRGLHLVDGLVDRWGVNRGPPSTVWFEIDLDARTPDADVSA